MVREGALTRLQEDEEARNDRDDENPHWLISAHPSNLR